MQRVCLINIPSLRKRAVSRSMAGGLGFDGGAGMVLPPLDLALMAATLRGVGYEVDLIDADPLGLDDLDVYEQLAGKVYTALIASVSLPTVENDAQFIAGLKQRHPEARVCAKTLVRDQSVLKELLHKSDADLVIHGEAELSIPRLITGETRDGTAWLEDGQLRFAEGQPVADLNLLPLPARDLLPNERYTYPLLGAPVATLQTSRGCPFPCAYYCPYPLVEGKVWRAQTPERIFAELKEVVEQLGIRKIYFRDATFTLDKERITRLCDLIIAACWQIEWMCETRVDCLSDELLEKMKAAGCVGMLIGVETGDENVMHRKEGKKGLTLPKLAHMRQKTRELRLKLHFLLIVGLPHETRESTLATYELIMRYDPDTVGVTILTPYPGTPLYYEGRRERWIESYNWRDYGGHQVVMRTPHLSRQDLLSAKHFLEGGFALLQRGRAEGQSSQLEHLKKRHYIELLRWTYELGEMQQRICRALDRKQVQKDAERDNAAKTVQSSAAGFQPSLEREGILLSVIIPTYNRKSTLRKVLMSYCAQTVESEKFEVIVVDDGSTDDTLAMLKKLKTGFVLRVLSQEHRGANAARNLCIRNAQGWIVLITGDDMVPSPSLVETHLKFHLRHKDEHDAMLGFIDWSPEITVTPFMRYIVSPGGEQQFAFHRVRDGRADFRLFYTSNISLKRSLLIKQAVLFDPDFSYPAYDDIELGYRLQRQGMQLHYRPQALTYHHHEITTEGFMQRQRRAGQMAVVFARKHPELDRELLGVGNILHSPNAPDERMLKGVLEVALELEKPDAKKLATLRMGGEALDAVYARTILCPLYNSLLRMAYVAGVIEGSQLGGAVPHVGQSDMRAELAEPKAAPSGEWPAEVIEHVRQADLQFSQGDLAAARRALNQALAILPNDPQLIVTLGNVLLRLGDVEAARREFVKATALSPEYVPAHSNLAAVLLHLGRAEEAEASAKRALALNSGDTDALKVLARLYLESERYPEAVQAYATILRHVPEDVETLLILANCFAEVGRLEEASALYQRVLQLDPDNAVAKENLATVNSKEPASDRAISTGLPVRLPVRQTGCTQTGSETSEREAVHVSIIIPVFNRLDLTRQCLDSIRRNTPSDQYEIVVVDNGSRDGTTDFLRQEMETGCLRAIFNADNAGFARASNQGACAASGPYLLFLNNDTEVQPGWFEPLVTVLDADAMVAAVGSKLLFPDGTIQHAGVIIIDDQKGLRRVCPSHIYYREAAHLPEVNQPRAYQALTAACLLMRKSAFEQVGGFDEEYWNGFEDVDLCFKIGECGWRLVYEPASVVVHYESQSGPERFQWESRNLERLCRKWVGRVVPDLLIQPDGQCVGTNAGRVQPYRRPSRSPSGGAETSSTRREPLASIVIVTYNSSSTIRACLESVFQCTQPPIEVIVVDNASTDETPTILAEYQGRICALLNSENRGFSRGCNQGIRASHGNYVVLLNPDTVVTSGWLDRLVAHFRPDVGAVGPVSDYVAGLQKVGLYLPEQVPHDLSLAEAGDLLGQVNACKAVETRLLIGFCMVLPRKVLDEVGLLDEELFLGNDDLDLSWRLRQRGYRLLVATDTFVHHEGQVSFKSEPSATTARLVQESTDRLYAKLEAHYGKGNVSDPMELWGINWFKPTVARFRSKAPAAEGGLTSIIILTHNGLEHTEKCLASIAAHTPGPHELIIVDNGSTDGTLDYLRDYIAKHDNVRVIANVANRGFAAGNNQGLALARGDYVLLLNNDTIVTPGWLGRMLAVFHQHPQVGVVGPMSNYVSGPQLVRDASYTTPEELARFSARWAAEHAGQSVLITRVVGFCLLARKQVIERIGGLDEQFGSGNFEDDDFCIRAAQVGYAARIAQDVFIHHTGSQTFKAAGIDYRESLLRNWGLFKAKWGIPAESPYEQGYRVPLQPLPGLRLHVQPPDLSADHHAEAEGCWWQEICGEPVEPIDEDLGRSQPTITAQKRLSVVIVPNGHGLAPLWPSLVQHTNHPLAISILPSTGSGNGAGPAHEAACPEGWQIRPCDLSSVQRLNQLMQSSGDGPVILLSSNLVLTPGWLKRLLAALNRDQRLAAVGPTSNQGATPQRVKAEYKGTGKALRQFALRRAHRNGEELAAVDSLAPFCIVLKSSVCRSIGPLREDLDLGASLHDYFTRLRQAGGMLGVALDAYVHCDQPDEGVHK